MKKYIKSIAALMLCVMWASCAQAQDPNDPNNPEEAVVRIMLTKFDVNDTRLELGWKIRNNSDHDVWISNGYRAFERFMDVDYKTLVLRKRFNLPEGSGWERLPKAQYVRLRPGQEKVDSIALTVPVTPRSVFRVIAGNAEYAERLSLEIGFYDEDLRGLILDIVEIAEKLNCDTSAIYSLDSDTDMEVYHRFFGGVMIAEFFNSESSAYFRDSVLSGGDEIKIPYMSQSLNGEQILRLEIENVSIPYKSDNPPLISQEDKAIKDERAQRANIAGQRKAESDKG